MKRVPNQASTQLVGKLLFIKLVILFKNLIFSKLHTKLETYFRSSPHHEERCAQNGSKKKYGRNCVFRSKSGPTYLPMEAIEPKKGDRILCVLVLKLTIKMKEIRAKFLFEPRRTVDKYMAL
jgi:hypothetical protein